MTATARGTPSLSIAPTQHTAPVHEFRCMFSHDLRKKKKTWHDGSLRFHTFNKRVMVYDEVKNFIGDLHYRLAVEFGEGTELQLDKGILVQVEDRIGHTETDLTPLLDKRRSDDAPSGLQAGEPLGTRPGLSYLPSAQGKPKSLAAVLGTSQGPMGRARLPTRSPYEQMQNVTIPIPTYEPPPKRRKISTGKENQNETGESTSRSGKLKEPRRKVDASPRPQSPVLKNMLDTGPGDVVDISSDEEPVRTKSESAKSKSKLGTEDSKTEKRRDPAPPPKPKSKPSRPKQDRGRITELEGSLSHDSLQKMASSDHVAPWVRPCLPGKTQLRFAEGRPRPRLMYRDLISSSDKGTRRAAQCAVSPATKSKSNSPSQLLQTSGSGSFVAKQNVGNDCNIFDIEDIDQLEVGPLEVTSLTARSITSPLRPRHQGGSANSSPLFCSPLSRHVEKITEPSHDDFIVPSSIEAYSLQISTSPAKSPTRDVTSTTPRQKNMNNQVSNLKSPEPNKLTLLDQRILMPPPAPVEMLAGRAQESPSPMPLRRVFSAGNPLTSTEQGVESRHKIPTALESIRAKQNGFATVPRAFKNPTKLQRSVSDISGFNSPTTAVRMPAPDDSRHKSGAWTEVEAYLLFDWWPPGRSKPPYGDSGQMQPGIRGGARGVLRDEANVL